MIEYKTPAQRIADVRRLRERLNMDDEEFRASLEYAEWKGAGILAIPDPYNLPDFCYSDRARLRREIARLDWTERIKRKRRVGLKTRRVVITLAMGECEYCNRPVFTDRDFEIDHVIPVTRGGRSNLANLAAACHRCNKSKRDMTVSEWTEAQVAYAFDLTAKIMARCEATGTPPEDVWPLNRNAPRPV